MPDSRTIMINLNGNDYSSLSEEAHFQGSNIEAMVASMVAEIAKGLPEKRERLRLMSGILGVMAMKAYELPTLISIFAHVVQGMESKASMLVDEMISEDSV